MTYFDPSALRLQLLARGYKIIPNHGKVPGLPGWNSPEYIARELGDKAASRIPRWALRFPEAPSTGLLICDGLVVLDFDVDDERMTQKLWSALATFNLDVADRAPTRFGGGEFKAALFCRLDPADEPFVRLASRKYGEHCVEVFGGARLRNGNVSRQFGIYGPHSFDELGHEIRQYVWTDGVPALHEVDAASLPVITRKQVAGLIDHFDQLAIEAGWKPNAAPDVSGDVVYDIDEDTRFDTNRGGSQISYDDLCAEYEAYGEGLRCSAGFMPDRGDSRRRDRCLVGNANRHQVVAVWVPGDEALHFPSSLKPQPDAVLDAIAQIPHEAAMIVPKRPDDDADMTAKACFLGQAYGYCALSDSVVELHKPADDCSLRPPAFQRLFRAWREQVKGPRGGIKYSYATSYWEVNPARIDLEGVRMRPDQPFPLYAEAGRIFKNTYQRPMHAGTGEIQSWSDFMTHLLPVTREREWFVDWLAHKHRFPGVPGVAVIMVATGEEGPIYGAGRGILRDILSRLLGPGYVKPIDFDVFTGRSAQGVYTDWGAYATLVTVNEAKDTPDSGRWTERRAVYERLREIVDPRAIQRTFLRKGQPAFTALSFASYLVFSNNRDALQIPPGDRRITALANGAQMTPEMAAGLEAWMGQPGNIAALAAFLEARDLAGFNVYQPLVTETKTVMQELARNDLDDAFDKVRRRIGPHRLFTGEQIRHAVLSEMDDSMPSETVRHGITRLIRAEAVQVQGSYEGEFRLPGTEGRHRIMHWRGSKSFAGNPETARSMVHETAKVLSDLTSRVVAGPWAGPPGST